MHRVIQDILHRYPFFKTYLRQVRATLTRLHGKSRKCAYRIFKPSPPEIIDGSSYRFLTTESFADTDLATLVNECVQTATSLGVNRIWNDHIYWGGGIIGQYNLFDAYILCGLVNKFQIKSVIECAPYMGWSTLLIQVSLPSNNVFHVSFDTGDFEEKIRSTVSRWTALRSNYMFVRGDFRETANEYSALLPKADLLFLDADHSADFARWYLEEFNILERLKPGALVQIHDIYPEDAVPVLPGYDFSESLIVTEWLRTRHSDWDVISTYELMRRLDIRKLFSSSQRELFLDWPIGGFSPGTNCALWLRRKAR